MVTTAKRIVAKSTPWGQNGPWEKSKSWETFVALLKLTSSLLAVYWVAIFIATHLPSSSLPSLGSDKTYHLLAFAGLGFLLMWVMSQKLTSTLAQIALVLTISIAYGCFDEWSQQFVAGRTPDVSDAIADACGAVLGVVSLLVLRATGWAWFRPASVPGY